MVCDARAFVEPVIKHHTKLNFPTFCFLLERQTNDGPRYTLYDSGARKDFWNGSPMAKSMIGNHISGLEVEKGVEEVLLENGIDLGKLGMYRSIITSLARIFSFIPSNLPSLKMRLYGVTGTGIILEMCLGFLTLSTSSLGLASSKISPQGGHKIPAPLYWRRI
jgi:hypothetical protein